MFVFKRDKGNLYPLSLRGMKVYYKITYREEIFLTFSSASKIKACPGRGSVDARGSAGAGKYIP